MKPPWQPVSQEGAELEALQTDVMRFVAILGLCLAAIFSLVHSTPPQQSEMQTEVAGELAPAAQPSATPAATPEPERHPDARLSPEISSVSVAADIPGHSNRRDSEGFSLEFASPAEFHHLLISEQIQLYVKGKEGYQRLAPDGVFRVAEAPASYYQMHSDTVPRDLRDALAQTGDELAWGVVLPRETVGQIRQLMAEHMGGNLVISRAGSPGLNVIIEP